MNFETHLSQLVQSGATVSVDLAGGGRLEPWPIDYLRLAEGQIAYWWTGDETRIHQHALVGALEEGEDGEVIARTEEGHTLHIEPIWDSRHTALLAAWMARLAAREAARAYPEGGWRYGQV